MEDSEDSKGKKKICPRCGAVGTGPYARWVLNGVKKRYQPFYYFAHKHGKKISWCYLGHLKELSNTHESHLSPEEQAILNAKPCEEPDRAKIVWSALEKFKSGDGGIHN